MKELLRVIWIYLCYKRGHRIKDRIVKFYVSCYKQTFCIRTNTSDIVVFWALCLAGEYDIDWPDGFSADTIVDAGANIGFFSKIISYKFPKSKIIALEPDQDNYEMLLANCKENPNVIPVLGGLWSKDTYIKVHSENEAYGITVEESETPTDIKAFCVNTLKEHYKLNTIDIFKIDIEGSEYQLFSENYADWIADINCYIIEIHEYFHEGCQKLIQKRLTQEQDYVVSNHMEDTLYWKMKKR